MQTTSEKLDAWKAIYARLQAAQKQLLLAVEALDDEKIKLHGAEVERYVAESDVALKAVHDALEAEKKR